MRGLVGWVGFRRTGVPYDRAPRERGQSNANLIQCVAYALHAIVCFSGKPLQFATFFGFAVTLLTMVLGVIYFILHLVHPAFLPAASPGITTIIFLILFSLGVQSVFLGLIGEYLARVYNQGKGRPLYVVDESVGLAPGNKV